MSKKHPHDYTLLLDWRNTKQKGFLLVVLIWILVILLSLFYICIIGSAFVKGSPTELKVMSYNIWNYHSYWNTRKKGVAEVIRIAYPDIVLLQEVRYGQLNKQLDDLMGLLPFLKYSAFAVATPRADANSDEGILSQYPITEVHHYNFTIVQTDGDRNTRACLSATIDVPVLGKVKVYVTHLSYEKTVQCRQVAELLTYIEKDTEKVECSKQIPTIVAGDFNVSLIYHHDNSLHAVDFAHIYADYEAPSDVLTKPLSNTNPCYPHLGANFRAEQEGETDAKFADVWRSLHPDDPGLTFSLMPFKDAEHFVPSKGLESRPDRIYLKSDSCVLRATSIQRTPGEEYETLFNDQILYEQLNVHLQSVGNVYVIYAPPLLFIIYTLIRVPRIYIVFALMSAVYVYTHVKGYPSNPDDFHPSDHLALVSTFAPLNSNL